MKRETVSIAFACALGAFIGALVSLELTSHFKHGSYFWGLGALIGGAVAYVAVDFRHLCEGVARAYRQVVGWRPDSEYWMTWLAAFTKVFAFTGNFVLVCILVHVELIISMPFLKSFLGFLSLWLLIGVVSSPIGAFMIMGDARTKPPLWSTQRKNDYKVAFRVNPLCLFFWLVYKMFYALAYLPYVVVRTCTLVKSATTKMVLLVSRVLIYVHSSRRTLCFTDGAFGAATGYALGSATIGAVVGAILGVLHYEVVSVRLLRLDVRD